MFRYEKVLFLEYGEYIRALLLGNREKRVTVLFLYIKVLFLASARGNSIPCASRSRRCEYFASRLLYVLLYPFDSAATAFLDAFVFWTSSR